VARRQSRSKPKHSNASEGIRALPWGFIVRALFLVNARWRTLSVKERARLRSLLGSYAIGPAELSAKERKEMHKLLHKLNLRRLRRELILLGARAARRRKKMVRRRRARCR
jgi:hypothetical protein